MLLRFKIWVPHFLKLMPFVFLGLIVSFFPIATLNHKYTGSWTGDAMNQTKVALNNPIAGVFGNSLILTYASIQPPVLVSPLRVNDFATHLLPSPFKAWLLERFPRFELKMGELPSEESAGMGLGVIACLILWISLRCHSASPACRIWRQPWLLLGIAGLASTFFYMAKMGSESTARLLLPYYPFLFLLPLGFCGNSSLATKKMRWVLLLFVSSVLFPLISSPAHPLLPIHRILDAAGVNPQFSRVRLVYDTYAQRGNCFASLLDMIPLGTKTLGFFSHEDDLEAPLWRPFGSRNVARVDERFDTLDQLPTAQAWLARRDVATRLIKTRAWNLFWKEAGSKLITQKASVGPEVWVLFLPR
jgi:hypothetical protein